MALTFVSWTQSPTDGVMTTGSTKSVDVAVQSGDLIVCVGGTQNQLTDVTTISGGSLTWDLLEDNDAGAVQMSSAKMWAATATSSTTVTVQVSASNTDYGWAMGAWVWRGHDGCGESVQGDSGNTQTAVTLGLTTTAAGSAICALVVDWYGLSARSWDTIDSQSATADATVPATDGNNTLFQTAHWTDLGAAAAKTISMSGATQRWNMVATEVKAGAGATYLTVTGVTNLIG